MNNLDEFFEKILSSESKEDDAVIAVLKARGFFIDSCDNKYIISDNSHPDDFIYLNEILVKYEIGFVDGNQVVLSNSMNVICLKELFREFKLIGEGTGWNEGWKYFININNAPKASVRIMEAFIARFAKAMSACGVFVKGSCDGNHNSHQAYLQMYNDGSELWYQLICECCLLRRFNILWGEGFKTIVFSEAKRYETYYEINRAAEYLYENRLRFREIKKQALMDYSKNELRKMNKADIENVFSDRVRAAFADWLK